MFGIIKKIVAYVANEIAFFKARKAMEREKLVRESKRRDRVVSLLVSGTLKKA